MAGRQESVINGFYNALNVPGVSSLVNAIAFGSVDPGANEPYITFGVVFAEPIRTDSTIIEEPTVIVNVWDNSKLAQKAFKIQAAVEAALLAGISVAGYSVLDLEQDGQSDTIETEAGWQIVSRWKALIEKQV